jgi:hypothetical protein
VIEQSSPADIGRGRAARYGIAPFDAPAGALTLGVPGLAVDGVLPVGEPGDYSIHPAGQQPLDPRRRPFEEVVRISRRSGRAVPLYNDK